VLSRSRYPQVAQVDVAAADGSPPTSRRVLRPPLLWVGLLALVLTACQGSPAVPAGGSAASGGEFRIGTPFLSQPDPVRGGFNAVQFGLAETLMRLDTDLQPQPWLAAAVQPRSGTTWEVRLREGVTFHDGAAMDATAVKASLERAVELSPTAQTLLGLRSITIDDPLTLSISTEAPTPNFPGLLTDPSTAIVSAASAAALGEAFTDRPVTTAMFRVERYELDRELVAVRYDDYWGEPARAERLVVTVLPDASARFLGLQSGQLDVAVDIQPESVGQVQGDDELRAVAAAPVATIFTYLNQAQAPLNDLRVRQALAHALPPRETVVQAVLRGEGEPAEGIFPPAVLECGANQPYRHDPEAARRLLASAGYRDSDADGVVERDGRPLRLVLLSYPQRPALTPTAEILQSALAEVGVKVEIQVVEQIDQALERDSWQASMYFNNLASTGDPYGSLSRFFRTGGDANAGQYSNEAVDRDIDQLRTLTEREQRRDLACQIERQLALDVAVLPLAYPNYVYGVGPDVTGFDTAHPYFLYFITGEIGKG
jgi:peptide/nickel transport system substrate-binding protein